VNLPERVRSIVVSGSPGMANTAPLGTGALVASKTINREFARKVAQQLFSADRFITDEIINRTLAIFSNHTIIRNMLRYSGLRESMMYEPSCHISNVRLCCSGRERRGDPPADWEHHCSLLKKGTWKVIAASGHSPMIEHPFQFYSLLWIF